MNPREPSPSFEAARRQHLIDATIEALGDVGFKATSLSQIARRADVSTGLFAHYFGDKDGLLEATLRFMAARLTRAARQRLRAAETRRERLYAVPDSALADQEFERRTSAVWLAFWGQITHSARYKHIQFIYQRRMISNLRHDLRALVPASCVEIYADMIASMIDGVWLRSHASPTQADAANARAMVRALIDGLVDGASATLEPAKPGALPIRPPDIALSRCVIEVISPVTKAHLGVFPAARHDEIADAVDRARQGGRAWRRMSGTEREHALRRCGAALRADGEELARLDALCTGRAIAQTLGIGVPAAALTFEHLAAVASQPTNACVELGSGLFRQTRHEPVGIVAGFGHWSAPLFGACRQVAPALAFGNAMIFQPDEHAPLTAQRLDGLLVRSGVPAGVLTIVNGDHATARLLREAADAAVPDPGLAPKTSTLVFATADMDQAVLAILGGCRGYAPTPDLSETRVFVERTGLARFRACLLAHLGRVRWGSPLDPESQIGSLISQRHLQHVRALIAQSADMGAELLVGGTVKAGRTRGFALAPTILDGCAIDMPILHEPLFAPVLALLPFEDDDEIIDIVAKHGNGAPAGLFGADLAHAHRVANQLRTSFCCLNDSGLALGDGIDCGRLEHGTTDTRSSFYFRSKRIIYRDDSRLDAERSA